MNTGMIALSLGCLGLSAEIVFTSFCAFADNVRKGHWEWAFAGHTNLWVFFLYASAAVAFPMVYAVVEHWPLLARALLYGSLILAVEFAAGIILTYFTGRCPWEYNSKWAVKRVIRLDYYPFWAAFGLILESAYLYLQHLSLS